MIQSKLYLSKQFHVYKLHSLLFLGLLTQPKYLVFSFRRALLKLEPGVFFHARTHKLFPKAILKKEITHPYLDIGVKICHQL